MFEGIFTSFIAFAVLAMVSAGSMDYIEDDETDSDAILRAMELCDPKMNFYVKEYFGVE